MNGVLSGSHDTVFLTLLQLHVERRAAAECITLTEMVQVMEKGIEVFYVVDLIRIVARYGDPIYSYLYIPKR
ncbi:hypothetical protein Q1695_003179 [Nippostrongylus brasiliensis]|nr:hypothetical protein Q1695_003179 [Nippostrongylus brasiliensis]